jgi:hypothetical protein
MNRKTDDRFTFKKGGKYNLALSFAGEDREIADEIAHDLKARGLKIFYDKFEQSDLLGKDLYQHLQHIYRDAADFCIIIVSKAYSEKRWTRHELKQAQTRAFLQNSEYILPLRIDDTELPGLNPTSSSLILIRA